jgi:integrase
MEQVRHEFLKRLSSENQQSSMRLMECLRLRVKDIDFRQNQIIVRDGKGGKDRVTLLPGRLKADLRDHLNRIKGLHQQKVHFASLTCITVVIQIVELNRTHGFRQ